MARICSPGFRVAARALEHGWRVGSGYRAGTKCRQARSGAPASVAQSVARTLHTCREWHTKTVCTAVSWAHFARFTLGAWKCQNYLKTQVSGCTLTLLPVLNTVTSEMSAIIVTMRNQCQWEVSATIIVSDNLCTHHNASCHIRHTFCDISSREEIRNTKEILTIFSLHKVAVTIHWLVFSVGYFWPGVSVVCPGQQPQ